MFPSIVADIGGTNARFALVTDEINGQPQIEHIDVLDGSAYATFEDAIQAYVEKLGIAMPKAACVAIAGPIDGDDARMTNLDWRFSQAGVKQRFGFDNFAAINDFAALSIATSKLAAADLTEIRSGVSDPQGNKAILGPGTGLGVAGLAYARGTWLPIPSEGGHVNVSPATELECDVIKAAMAEHGHVSAEIFISGPGLVRLYRALASVRGETPEALEPKDVTARALSQSGESANALCRETLSLFCSFLGNLSGNLALTYGAQGGVYLAGGIVPRILDFLRASDFNTQFAAKGVMSHYLEDIPVYLMSHPQPGLLGSAAWLAALQK